MFFISRGTVRVFVTHEDSCGDERRSENYIISLGAGSFFGEVALLEEVTPIHKSLSGMTVDAVKQGRKGNNPNQTTFSEVLVCAKAFLLTRWPANAMIMWATTYGDLEDVRDKMGPP